MIIPSKHDGWVKNVRRVYDSGGGSSAPAQQTVTKEVPEWAKETAQRGLARAEALSETPYQTYGDWAKQQGVSGERIQGFDPLQQRAYQNVSDMRMPGQTGEASNIAQEASYRALNSQYQPGQFGNQFRAPRDYQTGQFDYLQAQAPDLQQHQMGPAERVAGGQYDAPQMDTAQTGYRPDIQAFQMGPAERVAAGQYATPEMTAAQTGYRPDLQQFQMGPAQQVGTQDYTGGNVAKYMDPYMQQVVGVQQREAQRQSDIAGTQEAGQAVKQGAFGGSRAGLLEAERQRNLATQLGNIQATGSQAAFQNAQQQFNQQQQRDLQAQQANQQAGLTTGQQNLAAQLGVQQLGTQTGLQSALANLNNQQQAAVQNQAAQLQTQGLSAGQAMQAALANQQAGLTVGQQNLASQQQAQQLGTQTGLQTALANLSSEQQANVQNQAAQLQTQGLSAGQAMQAALANQQAGLTTGQQNLAARMGTQQFGAGQNMQAQLANQQARAAAQTAREQSRQFGAGQGMTAAQARAQYGLAGQQLGEQSRQYGAGYGQQGLQTALQGAGQLGNLGQTQFGQQKDLYGLQNQYGQQQRDYEQQIKTQQYQDFLNQRKNPYQQLEFLTNILQGTPMGTVQSMYQAPPTGLQTLGSLGLGAYGAKQLGMFAKGGSVTSKYFVADALDRLGKDQLDQAEQIAKANKDQQRLQLIADEKATRASESRGMASAYNSLPQSVQARMAGGGIVAFAGDDDENDGSQLVSGDSAADVINAQLASPGNPDRYQQALDAAMERIQAMGDYKPEQLTQEELDELIRKRFALEQKLAGASPYGGIEKYVSEAQADRPQALQQAKGLAALKAMSAIVQPGGFIRGLAGAGGAAGDTMEKAYQADRAEKRALASMQFNMADAQRKERMGMTRSAMDAATQAQKDKREAGKAHLQLLSNQATASARLAQAAKPTGQKGPSGPKLAEQLGAAEIAVRQNPTPENIANVEALRATMDRAKTSDFGPDRITAMMAGLAGQRSDAQLRADVARETQDRLVADKVLEARTRAQYSPAYLAAKTDAARAEVLKKAEVDARAVYGPTPSATSTARPSNRQPNVIRLPD